MTPNLLDLSLNFHFGVGVGVFDSPLASSNDIGGTVLGIVKQGLDVFLPCFG
jgi:hypothetical protein